MTSARFREKVFLEQWFDHSDHLRSDVKIKSDDETCQPHTDLRRCRIRSTSTRRVAGVNVAAATKVTP